jgi:phage gp36-like protein
MYIDTATSILPLLPTLPQTTTGGNYSITVSRISLHITRAEAYINGKISSRYDVSGYTSSTAPPMLRQIAEDITSFYYLRSVFTGDNQNISEWVENYGEALKLLDEIRDGKVDLVNTAGSLIGASTTTSPIESSTKDLEPTFNEGDELDWNVDTDKLG